MIDIPQKLLSSSCFTPVSTSVKGKGVCRDFSSCGFPFAVFSPLIGRFSFRGWVLVQWGIQRIEQICTSVLPVEVQSCFVLFFPLLPFLV